MKALVYTEAHAIDQFAITLADIAEPTLREHDVLVEVRAIGINPGEAMVRRTRSAEPGGRVLLGWEFAGVVVGAGPAVDQLAIGDRVYGTGDVTRDGCWAERVAVDHRVVARIPDALSFGDAASLPIGALTAWEAMFRHAGALPPGIERVLILGGAGGVGSLATQLLKAKTGVFVISTGSRPESRAWCAQMGADLVLDHAGDLAAQLAAANVPHVDVVLSTAGSAEGMGRIASVLRPFGHVCVVDGGGDGGALMMKSASLHVEMVFSKIIHGYDVASQGQFLDDLAGLVSAGTVRPIATTNLRGLSADTMKAAHHAVETRRTIGKVIIET